MHKDWLVPHIHAALSSHLFWVWTQMLFFTVKPMPPNLKLQGPTYYLFSFPYIFSPMAPAISCVLFSYLVFIFLFPLKYEFYMASIFVCFDHCSGQGQSYILWILTHNLGVLLKKEVFSPQNFTFYKPDKINIIKSRKMTVLVN